MAKWTVILVRSANHERREQAMIEDIPQQGYSEYLLHRVEAPTPMAARAKARRDQVMADAAAITAGKLTLLRAPIADQSCYVNVSTCLGWPLITRNV